MKNCPIGLVVGSVIGWLASMLMKPNDQQGVVQNMVVIAVGALWRGRAGTATSTLARSRGATLGWDSTVHARRNTQYAIRKACNRVSGACRRLC